jgi:hypothetical protein
MSSNETFSTIVIGGDQGSPRHVRGVVPEAPGLYFFGLHFQTGLTYSLLGDVGEDAKYFRNQVLLCNLGETTFNSFGGYTNIGWRDRRLDHKIFPNTILPLGSCRIR